jgi:hypothetical protein
MLDDRLEAALEAGTIDLIDEGEDLADAVEITLGEFNRIRAILLREEFVPLKPAARPTNCPPGSAGKVAEMERRAAAGESLTHRLDADPLADDRQGADVLGSTGRGPRMVPMVADELIDDVPANRADRFGGRGLPSEKRTHRELRDE